MLKVIVTNAVFTGYSTIFNLNGDNLDLRYSTKHMFSSSVDLPGLSFLPFDIKYEILERVVLQLLKEGHIKKALDTLLLANSEACCIFYTKHIGYYNLTRLQIIKHLISMFYLIHDIHSNLYFNDSTSSTELFLSLFCINATIDILQDKRWPFGKLSHSFMDDIPIILEKQAEKTFKVITGGSYADIIWMSGKEEDGIISTNYLKGPVVILEVYNIGYGLIHTVIEKRTPFFKRFVKILKLALGEYSGVYTTFPIEGFAGLVSEVV